MRRSVLVLLILLLAVAPSAAQTNDPIPDPPPFLWPIADEPGPNTWLYEQHFGNTTSAFNYGNIWYSAGQGLHFGLDIEVACETPVRAIADGVVAYVDGEGFGSEPHNLVLQHPGTGYSSLYGHLFATPLLVRGQTVKRGEVIALSGDPDSSCESRPHLHLEIRSEGYMVSYNPVPFFEIDWHMITSIGPFVNNFQQDLQTPYRWMKIEDQPDVNFGNDILNRYTEPWPPKLELRAPVNSPLARALDPVSEDTTVTRTPITTSAWGLGAWWNPSDLDAIYVVGTVPGQNPGVFRQPVDGSPRTYVGPIPPKQFSPDGTITVERQPDAGMRLTDTTTGENWEVLTQGYFPAISPENKQLLWEVYYGDLVPGTAHPGVEIWVSDIDGTGQRVVHTLANGYTLWLDENHLLGVRRITYTAETELYILDLREDGWPEKQMLGTYRNLRGLQIAPGGERIVFFLPFQPDPDDSGIYVQSTRPGSTPTQLDFFGAYRWRDDRSLYTLSFEPDVFGTETHAHALGVYDISRRTHTILTDPATLPLRIANGEWNVAPDGSRITYVDPADYGLYLLTTSSP